MLSNQCSLYHLLGATSYMTHQAIKGRYFLVINKLGHTADSEGEKRDSLVQGERLDPTPHPREDPSQQSATFLSKKTSKHEVAQAFSLLKSSSNLSDITFTDEKEKNKGDFERVRLAL